MNHLDGEPVAVADQPEDVSVDYSSSLLSSTEDEASRVFPVSTLPGQASPQQLSWRLPEVMRQRLCEESLSEEDDTSETQHTIKIPQILTVPVSSASTHREPEAGPSGIKLVSTHYSQTSTAILKKNYAIYRKICHLKQKKMFHSENNLFVCFPFFILALLCSFLLPNQIF